MRTTIATTILAAVLGCREPTIAEPPAPAPDPVVIVPAVVHTDAPAVVTAGEPLLVRCSVEDGTGEGFEDLAGIEPTIRVVPEGSVRAGEPMEAVRAGEVEVVCAYGDLVDETPAATQIVAGPPAHVDIEVDADSLGAGEVLTATCAATDRHGNPVSDATPGLRVLPYDPANPIEGLSATMTRAGVYEVSCELAGATASTRLVEVVPGAPDRLVIGPEPDLPVYGLGQTVTIRTRVADAFGNAVLDAVPELGSAPAGTRFGSDGFRYFEDGRYTVTATLPGLSASTDLTVDGAGPLIQCDRDGTMVTAAPGATIPFAGTVTDPNAVASLTVDGRPVAVGAGGAFATTVPVEFGHNFVDVTATDGFGVQSTRICTFLASPTWAAEDALVDDAISLSLFQEAVDDGNRAGSPDSLADLLAAVVDSPGLVDTLDSALRGANPLKNSCDQTLFGACIFRSRLDYRSARVSGPNTSQIALVSGGLDAGVVIRNVAIDVDLSGTIDTDVRATFDAVSVQLGFDLRLDGTGPRAVVRSTQVSVQGLDVNFGGVPGFLEDIILALFGGAITDLVEDLLRDQIRDQFGAILDGLVSGLDVSALGTTVDVPRLDGSGVVPLSFGLGFTHLDVTPQRLRFGVGTLLSAPPAIATPSRGVAVPPGARLSDPQTGRPAAAAIHVALFDQALHALWRAGLFEAELTAADLGGGVAGGLSATLRSSLPPVARLTDDGVDLGIGPLTTELVLPGIFDDPLTIVIGARAAVQVAVEDGDLSFGDLVVEEVYLSAPDTPLDPGTRAALEDFAGALVQRIVDGALNDAIPALPVPSFTLPASVAPFGLPAGAELGLGSPQLSTAPPHFVLGGTFEVLP